MDLGASPTQAMRRVLLPLLYPAIFASSVLVFADTIDDFVIVRYLSLGASTEPMSVKIYNTARASPTPALNAARDDHARLDADRGRCWGSGRTGGWTRGERSGAGSIGEIAVQL